MLLKDCARQVLHRRRVRKEEFSICNHHRLLRPAMRRLASPNAHESLSLCWQPSSERHQRSGRPLPARCWRGWDPQVCLFSKSVLSQQAAAFAPAAWHGGAQRLQKHSQRHSWPRRRRCCPAAWRWAAWRRQQLLQALLAPSAAADLAQQLGTRELLAAGSGESGAAAAACCGGHEKGSTQQGAAARPMPDQECVGRLQGVLPATAAAQLAPFIQQPACRVGRRPQRLHVVADASRVIRGVCACWPAGGSAGAGAPRLITLASPTRQ
jgi:hypothetical protein